MIRCTLVHDTGTMIRFRPSQLGLLPLGDRDVLVQLPTGAVVQCHFNRNPANPNISGRELVEFINQRIAFGDREEITLTTPVDRPWVVQLHRDDVAE